MNHYTNYYYFYFLFSKFELTFKIYYNFNKFIQNKFPKKKLTLYIYICKYFLNLIYF